MTEHLENFTDATQFESIIQRVSKIQPDSVAGWGTMSAAQMFAHCAEVQEVLNGKMLRDTPFFVKLMGPLIKKMVLNSKPYPRRSRTHPQYLQTSEKDFGAEKDRLLESLAHFQEMSATEHAAKVHSLFGNMSMEEKGRAGYKHLDHHLQQFGV
ncbi:MAG: DUF1569 domain-containing protein [Rhodothermales bacterium]|nr:DUF1569 domain-containing protein [Rhodothermales bacterium]